MYCLATVTIIPALFFYASIFCKKVAKKLKKKCKSFERQKTKDKRPHRVCTPPLFAHFSRAHSYRMPMGFAHSYKVSALCPIVMGEAPIDSSRVSDSAKNFQKNKYPPALSYPMHRWPVLTDNTSIPYK